MIDLFSIRLHRISVILTVDAEDALNLSWGHRKPLFGATGFNCHQIGRSWRQIRGNWSQNLNFVSVSSILAWKCQISKALPSDFFPLENSVTRCHRNPHFRVKSRQIFRICGQKACFLDKKITLILCLVEHSLSYHSESVHQLSQIAPFFYKFQITIMLLATISSV